MCAFLPGALPQLCYYWLFRMDPDGAAFFLNGIMLGLSGFRNLFFPFANTKPLGQGLKNPLLSAIYFSRSAP